MFLDKLELKLKEPYTIAYETVDSAINFLLTIETDLNISGFGIACPDEYITGETPEDITRDFQSYIQAALTGEDPFYSTKILFDLSQHLKASALAMVDMALYDLIARQLHIPLYHLLGAYRNSMPTSITVGILPFEETLKKVADYIQDGFFIIKLKGGLNVVEDIRKIKAIRAKYPEIKLRFDGNQGFNLEEALFFVQEVKSEKVEIVEQPTKVKKEEWLGVINQKAAQPIMADESIKSLTDAFYLTSNGYTDMINIKIQKVGGIQNALHINSVAKAASNEVMVGCLDESALGISSGLHFALSRPNVHFADLDGHLDIINDPFSGLFSIKKGILYSNEKPGLGL